MATDMKARQLIKQVPAMFTNDINFDAGTATISGEGWELVHHPPMAMTFVWRGFIDLAGYTQDDLTFFSQAVDVQDNGVSIAAPSIGLTAIMDMVTTRRISDAEVNPVNGNGFLSPAPGTTIPGLDIQEVVYGNTRNFTPYSATNGAWRQIFGSSFGSGNPTASDRLHITRIVVPLGTGTSESVNITSCNFLIGGVTAHEKDLVYIERLRRAYTQERS
jgi:hypothetical protein